jgi:hypothetical protein
MINTVVEYVLPVFCLFVCLALDSRDHFKLCCLLLLLVLRVVLRNSDKSMLLRSVKLCHQLVVGCSRRGGGAIKWFPSSVIASQQW